MAIKAYNSNSGNSLIDTTVKFVEGDMLAFDARKNLFVRTTRAEIANVDLTGYATLAHVQSLIDNIDGGTATTIDWANVTNKPTIPSTDGLASETYVTQQIALSQPDLTSYSTKTYVDTAIAAALTGGADLTNYYTKTQVDTLLANYQPSIDLSGYATTGYVTNQLTAFQPKFDLSLYATKTYVAGEVFSGDYNDLTNKPTLFSGSYNDLTNKPTIFSGNYADLYNQPIIPSIDGLASIAYVDQQIANVSGGGSIDLSSYVTETELATALAGYQPTVDLTSYYTKTQVDGLITPHFSGDYNDLQNKPTIPSLSGYATQAYVDSAVANSGGGGGADLTGYATETYVQQQISAATLGAVANLNDLTDVAIDTSLDALYQGLMYNGISELWENRDLEDIFATKSYVTEQVANIISNGQINLDGYATESYVEQALLERGPHFSGDYNELYNRPILFSGDYRDLTNKPAESNDLQLQLANGTLKLVDVGPNPDVVLSTVDLTAITASLNYEDLDNLPSLFSGNYNDLVNRPVLFSGNYNDLANKPYIPSIAGLATETYVNNKHAEPNIWGDKVFKGSVTFENFTLQKVSTVSHTAAVKNMVMAIQTTNAVPTEVLLSTGGAIAIASGTTAMFKITFVATSGPDAASFIVRGIVDNNGSGVRLIGGNVTETIADSDQTWEGTASANTLNDSLKIVVTGSDATTVDWTIFVELSEVIR